MLRKNHLARCISLVMAGYAVAPLANAQSETDNPVLIRVTEGQSAEAARLSAAAIQTEPVQRLSSDASVSLSRMGGRGLDRKSTRLNSSHVRISYAVFCLKKKKKRISLPHW